MMEVKTFGVIGAGQMGAGIAQVAAKAGLEVTLIDIVEGATEKALAKMGKSLAKQVAKGRMEEADKAALLGRISTSADVDEEEAAAVSPRSAWIYIYIWKNRQ